MWWSRLHRFSTKKKIHGRFIFVFITGFFFFCYLVCARAFFFNATHLIRCCFVWCCIALFIWSLTFHCLSFFCSAASVVRRLFCFFFLNKCDVFAFYCHYYKYNIFIKYNMCCVLCFFFLVPFSFIRIFVYLCPRSRRCHRNRLPLIAVPAAFLSTCWNIFFFASFCDRLLSVHSIFDACYLLFFLSLALAAAATVYRTPFARMVNEPMVQKCSQHLPYFSPNSLSSELWS